MLGGSAVALQSRAGRQADEGEEGTRRRPARPVTKPRRTWIQWWGVDPTMVWQDPAAVARIGGEAAHLGQRERKKHRTLFRKKQSSMWFQKKQSDAWRSRAEELGTGPAATDGCDGGGHVGNSKPSSDTMLE